MEQQQAQGLPHGSSDDTIPPASPTDTVSHRGAVTPQATSATCPACGGAQAGVTATQPQSVFVYAIGQIEPRFPLISVEKELRQATKRTGGTVDLTDRQATAKVLNNPQNTYIIRELCWVLLIQGIETYILVPRNPADYQLLVDAYRASPDPGDIDAVIGVRGPLASPEMCNGLIVPILAFDLIYSFDRKSLLDGIPRPASADPAKFGAAAAEMFDQIMQQSDNAGATDAERALNYLALRYDQIYATAADSFGKNASFTSVRVLASPLRGTRKVVDVVFAFRDRSTDALSKYFVRVDVTEKWPFLVSKMSRYYDR